MINILTVSIAIWLGVTAFAVAIDVGPGYVADKMACWGERHPKSDHHGRHAKT